MWVKGEAVNYYLKKNQHKFLIPKANYFDSPREKKRKTNALIYALIVPKTLVNKI